MRHTHLAGSALARDPRRPVAGPDQRGGPDRARHDRGEDFKRGVDGESITDVARRVRDALDDLVGSMGPGQTVVIATHGVAGRAVVAELLDLPQSLAWQRLGGLSNCHWAEVVEGGNGWRLAAWNASA